VRSGVPWPLGLRYVQLCFAALTASVVVGGAGGAMTASKLSIHTSFGGPLSMQVVREAKPRLIKLLDTFHQAAQVKQLSPGCVVIGRIYLANQPTSGDPVQAAQNWFNANKGVILSSDSRAIDFWEGYNEPSSSSVAQMQWLGAFDEARVQILANHSKKAVIGCFSTGTPDVTHPDTIEAYFPAVRAAIRHGGILGLHEYSSPRMENLFSGSVATGEGWLTGRYRKLNAILAKAGLKVNMAITENGIDGGTCPDTGCHISGGWRNFCSDWSQKFTNCSNCNDCYLSQLEWYDSVMRADSYVIGSTIFSLEISGWQSFDITPAVPNLISYMQSQQ
jgi:hypothetical protein